ncbi:amidohydrolase family protein [Candidatus Woesearchaeota archaeon]|nr:amidohydrolase family protein [Candidatus Woesearchaeota archaeon]
MNNQIVNIHIDGQIISSITESVSDKIIKDLDTKHSENTSIDCKGMKTIPGIIDPHVHFRDFNQSSKEDWSTGSISAALGGVTSIIDMPNNDPPLVSISDLQNKRSYAQKSIINYGFHIAATMDNVDQLQSMLSQKDVASVKLFMDATTGNMLIESDRALSKIFDIVGRMSGIISVHAEGKNVQKAMELAKEYKTKLYLCHISRRDEIEYIRQNKTKNVFVEVTPHHLILSKEDVTSQNRPFLSMKPALQTKDDQASLWDAIKDRIVDTLGTDHAPHTIKEKTSQNPPYGVPGVQTMLALMINEVSKNNLTEEDIIRLCCTNPASIFNIDLRGSIKKGNYADIVIYDPDQKIKLKNADIASKCSWTPFDGRMACGMPVYVLINGQLVIENKKINSKRAGMPLEFGGK